MDAEHSLTLEDIQKKVDDWIKTYGVRYFSELTNMAVFKPGEKDNLSEEMADILWVLVCLANQTGVNLTEAFCASMQKKTERDKNRHLNNSKLY